MQPFYEEHKKTMEKSFENMLVNIDNHVQNNIMKFIGKDLYDYSDVPEWGDVPKHLLTI